MSIKALKKVVLCKVEATQGVDASPAAGTDALLALNVRVTPINIRYADRNTAVPFFGHAGQVNVGETMQLEYDIEIAGAGGVDTVPGYAAALRGCALSETVTPTTGPVSYAPISDSEESVSQYFFFEDQQHIMLGAFGSVEMRFTEGGFPVLHYTWEGIYGGVSTQSPGTPVLTAFQDALAMTKANTTFSLHGFAGVLSSLTLTQGNTTVYKNRPNSESMHFTDRKSTGQLTLELPKLAVKDFIAICRSGATGALALVHGTTAGNKVLIDAPAVQLTNPRYAEGDNIVELSMDMNLRYSAAGNDEFTYKTQ